MKRDASRESIRPAPFKPSSSAVQKTVNNPLSKSNLRKMKNRSPRQEDEKMRELNNLSKILIQQNMSPDMLSKERSSVQSGPRDFGIIEEKSDEEQQELRDLEDFFSRRLSLVQEEINLNRRKSRSPDKSSMRRDSIVGSGAESRLSRAKGLHSEIHKKSETNKWNVKDGAYGTLSYEKLL